MRLAGTATRDLRAEWQRLYRAAPPPRLSRDLLVRAIAYRIQERAGGPNAALGRRLRRLAKQFAAGDTVAGGAGSVLRPGARLVRDWRGETHTVTVIDGGFEYHGQRYRSLSRIARTITGTPWSGPRFFGLTRTGGKVAETGRPIARDAAGPGG